MHLVVIGAGVAGLSAAYYVRTRAPHVRVTVLEASGRTGGLVQTEFVDRCLIEAGPDCVHAPDARFVGLLDELELRGAIVAPSQPSCPYVRRAAELVPLPGGGTLNSLDALWQVLCSPLLSGPAKLRLLAEPWVRPAPELGDESVSDFMRRRLGAEFLEHVAKPLVSSIYSGDPKTLSARSVLPQLTAYEQRFGSITHGLLRSFLPRRRRASGAGATPTVFGFERGMETLPAALTAHVRDSVTYGATAQTIARVTGGAYVVQTSQGALDAHAVIVAAPVPIAARLCEHVAADAAHALSQVDVAPLYTATIAYDKRTLATLPPGTGLVTEPKRRGMVRACTWVSRKFPRCVPDDAFLVRCTADVGDLDESAAVLAIASELHALAGLPPQPRWVRIRRITPGLPRYQVGHGECITAAERAIEPLAHFAFAGNAYHGMGVPHATLSGFRAAERVLAQRVA